MSEQTTNQEQTTTIEDLPVNDAQQDEIKGGLLLPAVIAARESPRS